MNNKIRSPTMADHISNKLSHAAAMYFQLRKKNRQQMRESTSRELQVGTIL